MRKSCGYSRSASRYKCRITCLLFGDMSSYGILCPGGRGCQADVTSNVKHPPFQHGRTDMANLTATHAPAVGTVIGNRSIGSMPSVSVRILLAILAGGILGFWIASFAHRPATSAPDILARVQQLNQLATVRYTIQKVVGLTDQKYPVGSESILLIVEAHVEAGVDLAGLHPEDISAKNGVVVVRLPEPRILNAFIDEKDTKVWDRQKSWWAPWIPYSLDLEQRARIAGIESVKKTALEDGILTQAETNAETSIRQLLTLSGVKNIRFVPSKIS